MMIGQTELARGTATGYGGAAHEQTGLATGVGRIVGRENQVTLQVVDIYRLSAKQWRRLSPPCTMGTPATRWEQGRGQIRSYRTHIGGGY